MGSAPAAVAPKKRTKKTVIIILVVSFAACVPCTGILAAIAVPSFIQYVRRSKVSEARSNLRMLFSGAASYYTQEHPSAGPGGVSTHCTVGPARTANEPGPEQTLVGPVDPAFDALGFVLADPVYYQYEIVAAPSRCGHGPDEALYTFRAYGDLDGDGHRSTFELAVGSSQMNELYRSPGIYTEDELE